MSSIPFEGLCYAIYDIEGKTWYEQQTDCYRAHEGDLPYSHLRNKMLLEKIREQMEEHMFEYQWMWLGIVRHQWQWVYGE